MDISGGLFWISATIPEAWEPWEAGRLAAWDVKVPTGPFGIPIYTFRATIPEAWEAGMAGRLGGWEAGVLRA